MMITRHLLRIFVLTLLVIPVIGQGKKASDLLAEGKGIAISRAEIEAMASGQFENLEMERVRFEADQKKKQHKILEDTLEQMIKNRLLALEASSRNISVQELTEQEVNSKVTEVTDEDVDKFFEENKNRLREPKEKLAPQIKGYLTRQQSQGALDSFIDTLREKYSVSTNLEPLRFEVDPGDSPYYGSENAKVTLIEFSDFECPYCSRLAETLDRVKKEYSDTIKLVFRQYPLSKIHPNAQKAAEASLCAADQGKFWEMHDLLFADRKALKIEDLKAKAAQLDLDAGQFDSCLDNGKHASAVQADLRDGMAVGVSGTPALFINGRALSGAVAYETIVEIIKEELAAAN
jgi:protein-disulfide isomerase